MIFHVSAQTCDELKPMLKKQFGQGSRDVAAIPDELATLLPDHVGNRSAVINLAWSQAAREQR